MSSYTDAFKALFPHPEIAKFHDDNSEPTYVKIEAACVQLNANAAAIHSNGGDGELGYIILTIGQVEYKKISTGNVEFIIPTAPSVHPVHAATTTGPQITETNHLHKEQVRVFREYQNTDAVLKHLFLQAIADAYVCELKDEKLGYAKVTTAELIVHVRDRYGKIEPEMLEKNEESMATPWTPETLIAILFKQIDDGISFARAGNDDMSDERILRIALKIIKNTRRFPAAIRDWKKKTAVDKTWVNFKTHYMEAYQEIKAANMTVDEALKANYMAADESTVPSTTITDDVSIFDEIAPAFQSLAEAVAADRTALANLAASQQSDRSEIAQLRAELAAARLSIVQAATSIGGHQQQQQQHQGGTNEERPRPNLHYCWSHGFSRNPRHTSKSCRNKRENHKDDAVGTNRMGGNTLRKPANLE